MSVLFHFAFNYTCLALFHPFFAPAHIDTRARRSVLVANVLSVWAPGGSCAFSPFFVVSLCFICFSWQ